MLSSLDGGRREEPGRSLSSLVGVAPVAVVGGLFSRLLLVGGVVRVAATASSSALAVAAAAAGECEGSTASTCAWRGVERREMSRFSAPARRVKKSIAACRDAVAASSRPSDAVEPYRPAAAVEP